VVPGRQREGETHVAHRHRDTAVGIGDQRAGGVAQYRVDRHRDGGVEDGAAVVVVTRDDEGVPERTVDRGRARSRCYEPELRDVPGETGRAGVREHGAGRGIGPGDRYGAAGTGRAAGGDVHGLDLGECDVIIQCLVRRQGARSGPGTVAR
jgi:hypothetical protein